MSQPIRWSVSVDKETDAIAEILQQWYSDSVGAQRSRLVQFIIKRWYRLGMAGKLPAALLPEQGINQAISSEEITTFNNSSQNEFPAATPHMPLTGRAKPPVRTRSVQSARRGEVSGVSRRVATRREAVVWAYGTSFPLHSTRFSWRSA